MQKNTSVSIGLHFEKFIADIVEEERFGSKSEVVRAGLRLLEAHEIKLSFLRSALIAGEESGIAENYSLTSLIESLIRKTAYNAVFSVNGASQG